MTKRKGSPYPRTIFDSMGEKTALLSKAQALSDMGMPEDAVAVRSLVRGAAGPAAGGLRPRTGGGPSPAQGGVVLPQGLRREPRGQSVPCLLGWASARGDAARRRTDAYRVPRGVT